MQKNISTVVFCALALTGFLPSGASFAQSNAQTVATLSPGVAVSAQQSNAKLVRLSPGVSRAQVLQLRDDQLIETPSGRQLTVAKYRQLTQVIASAQARGVARAAAPFAYSKPAGGITLPASETSAQLLARPDSTVVRFANGAVATVAQVKAMKPFVEQRYGVSLDTPAVAAPSGPAVKVADLPSALAQVKNQSESTILESPKGTRVTVGQMRLALGIPALEAAQANKTRAGSTVVPITPAGAKP